MTDDVLIAVDEAFARSQREIAPPRPRLVRADIAREVDEPSGDDEAAGSGARHSTLWDRSLWLHAFLAMQFLWGTLLFVPGAQAYRGYIRALPYVSSLGLLLFYFMRRVPGPRPRSTALLVSALFLLVVNLLHPTSQLSAGLAQCVFQLSIAAPLFFAFKAVRSPERLDRLLMLAFVMNFASAALGILQVYFPDRFMPPQFNFHLADQYLETLSYLGADGRLIVRPPGLSDQPGGAALAGGLTVLLGLGLSLGKRSLFQRFGLVAAVAVGLGTIYLTQVRSALLMVIAGVAVLSLIAFRQRRVAAAAWIALGGGTLVFGAFVWAISVGGAVVEQRFLNIHEKGVLETYQENRGHYLAATVGEMLNEFPLGAGVGRWGMMNNYFGDTSDPRSTPLYVEPQLTGWLIDGGIPMWLLYGGAIIFSLLAGLGLTRSPDPQIANLALIVVPLQVFIAGLGMAGPIFNTQLGILFWLLPSALHGAAQNSATASAPASDTPGRGRASSVSQHVAP